MHDDVAADASAGERLLLASTSPRRRAILDQLAVPFDVVAPVYEEEELPDRAPHEVVATHAVGKARSVQARYPGRVILGVDTGVVLEGQLFGKPRDTADATRILTELAGKTHAVVSGLCLLQDKTEYVEVAETAVSFRRLSPAQIDGYVARGEWRGLAGGYAIQDLGALLVERVEGDYLNVVGLPSALLLTLLEQHWPALVPINT